MTPRKLSLAAEIVAAYVEVRWLLRRRGLRSALVALRAPAPAADAHGGVDTGRQLGHAVARTLRVLPANSRCLMQSLVLTKLLVRRGIPTQLVIAVRPGESFAAHAWIEHMGQALLPPGAAPYGQLVTL